MKTIKPIHIILILFIGFFIIDTGLQAQTRSIKNSVSNEIVAVGERFKFTITIENMKGQVTPPSFDGFNVIAGPMEENGRSNINGSVTSYVKYSYFLNAKKIGTFTIPASKIDTDGKKIASNSVKVKVVKDQNAVAKGSKQTKLGKGEDKNLFVRIYVNKSKVYKGEQVIATYVLYNRYQSLSMRSYEMPQLKGFWKEDIELAEISWEDKYEKVNGLDYQKAVLARQVLFTQKTGKLDIGPINFTGVTRRSFFSMDELPVVSSIARVEVVPLPGNAPKNYSGGVGQFEYEVIANNEDVKTNEAVTLRVKVSGKGNLKLISPPKIDFPSDFEVYDPKVIDGIRTTGGGMNGSRTFEYLVIPRYPGVYDLDGFTFSYFDPKKEKYITKENEKITFEVEGVEGEEAKISEARKKDVNLLDSDIRYISTQTNLKERFKRFAGSSMHVTTFFIPFVLLAGLFFYTKKRSADLEDVQGMRMKKAGKKAMKEISVARTALKDQKKESFYESVFDAMYNYLSEKLSIPYSELTKENIHEQLISQKVDEVTNNKLISLLKNCEMARFAPLAKSDEELMLTDAEEVIRNLEKQLT